MIKIADIESPYMSDNDDTLKRNILYARMACRYAIFKGFVPYASHLFFTQPGILNDDIPLERELGINSGKELIKNSATITIVFTDLGVSSGMEYGIQAAKEAGRPHMEVMLFNEHVIDYTFEELLELAKKYKLIDIDYGRRGW